MRIYLIILIFFNSLQVISQTNKTVIEIHANVGKEIDIIERNRYDLFKFYLSNDFKNAVVFNSAESIFVEITNTTDSIQKFILTESELKLEISKIENSLKESSTSASIINSGLGNDSKSVNKVYAVFSTSFYNINIFNVHALQNYGIMPKSVLKNLYNRTNVNAGLGFFISSNSSLELGINYSSISDATANIDTSYSAYFLVTRVSPTVYTAEVFDVNKKSFFATKFNNLGISFGVKSYIGKNNLIKTFIRNTLVFNVYNNAEFNINEELTYTRRTNGLVYSEKSNFSFESDRMGVNFLYSSAFGGE
jgi:hypothetical protein